ncbi:hypothetical protein Rhopal_004636-T1 [Rhodotorula paludigena]|uniref:Centromere protein S n=1 Tax=Rhodotorula paludigena TaxID=86838 RepID=A0AAV5GSH2_9BASI|nr:hypothetical protein Rhopal_004636-T1 [Rhodotorula paludigena]
MPRASKAADDEEPLSRQSLKAAVWYTVTKIAQEEELSLPFAASEHFVATLAEVVFQQALSLGKDLERFANHAGRLTINADDVKYELLCTTATQHGLTLADIKADSAASTSKASKVKAPRLAAGKSTTTASTSKKSSTSAGSEGAKEKSKSKEKSKGKEDKKGKKRAEESDADEQIDDPDDDDEPGLAGGFVKASALKKSVSRSKGKGKAVVADSEGDEEEGRRGGSSGDESEDVGAKRKRTSKGGAGASKKRRNAD